jgi:hypothetical protein
MCGPVQRRQASPFGLGDWEHETINDPEGIVAFGIIYTLVGVLGFVPEITTEVPDSGSVPLELASDS